MRNYISSKLASKITGLHPNTLRKYADNGTIPHYRLPNGDRRLDVSGLCHRQSRTVAYARVSQPKQKEDLKRQVTLLMSRYPEAEIIQDTASGLNFKRKGLRALLERLLQGESITIVVTYKDRLARFGFDLIEYLVERNGGEIVVLNQVNTSPTEELTKDLTAIITVFASRLHGLRSHAIKKDIAKAVGSAKGNTEVMDGNLSVGLQQDGGPKGEGIP